MTKEHVLEAIAKELEFYRSRQQSVHYFSIASILLAISGQQKLPIHDPIVAKGAYTAFFLLVAILNLMISRSYQERAHHLREVRANLFVGEPWPNPFPKHSEFKRVSPNSLYIVIVVAIAAMAALVVWFGS